MMRRNLIQFLLLVNFHCFCYSATAVSSNITDYEALLSIKSKITLDPFRVFTSWNDSVHFCSWQGITCSNRHTRATAIDLSSKALVGSLSPYIGNLTFLRQIRLFNNSLSGEIPPEIGRLFRLQVLLLQNNSFTGQVPSNLSHCSNLQNFRINFNGIEGKIPTEIGELLNLQILSIHFNLLVGPIPDSIGNLSSLQALSATNNYFSGSIPDSFGQLKSLSVLALGGNSLSGVVPLSVYNLSSITVFSICFNGGLRGSIPSNLGLLLSRLQHFDVRSNRFVGEIPKSLSNASQLEYISFGDNYFTGQVPRNLGTLQNLSTLEFYYNNLGSGGPNDMVFFPPLVNCTKLRKIGLHSNRFGGSLPVEIANLSIHMTSLSLGINQLSGTVTPGIGNLINLAQLDLSFNKLIGPVPISIGKLQKIRYLALHSNQLTGEIPSSIGNITWLTRLYLDHNRLQGTVPGSVKNCTNLLWLDLSVNSLNGSLPKEVFDIPSLSILLNLSHNQFTGPLPSSVGNMKALGKLDVSWNKFSGEIPAGLGSCIKVETLLMQHNSFEGSIPSSFSSLLGIQFLDLSMNNLTGLIPHSLENFKLLYLNLSYNNFEGEVPRKGVFTNFSGISVAGNNRLCGGIPKMLLPTCPIEKTNNKKISALWLSAIIVSSCLFVGLSILILWLRKKGRNLVSIGSLKEQYPKVSYEQILRATDSFSPSNLIGLGSFGAVYKGIIDEIGQLAAIKVINLQRRGASKSFMAECEALRSIRHRNLVRIITSCSSMDFQGNDFKALVYEYMPNGSLEKWMHPRNLDLHSRLNIAIDVASALDYLHHRCQEPVIHCDLKPSNVLLDNEMTAHVGDFGLATILGEDATNPKGSSSIGLKGTIGYAPPEYGLGGEASREGDVYSFGILMLEMMTGKRPTDGMFENGLNLHNYAMKAVSDGHVMDIVDPVIVRDVENEATTNQGRSSKSNAEECAIRMVQVGVACSMDLPADRMEMSLVVQKLLKIRDDF